MKNYAAEAWHKSEGFAAGLWDKTTGLFRGREASSAVAQVEPQGAVDRLIQPVRPTDDLVGRAAGDRLGREREGALRAAVGQVDRDHHRHAQRHAQNRQADLPGVLEQVP